MKPMIGNASQTGRAGRSLKTAVLVALSLLASSQVSQAQVIMSVDGPKQQTGKIDRDYQCGVWTSGGFEGSGFVQTFADQDTALMKWNSKKGGFQANKGLLSKTGSPSIPSDIVRVPISQMSYADGKGTATYEQLLSVQSADPKTQIWTGVQGWLIQLDKVHPNVEYYIVDKVDLGTAGIGADSKVGSVTIDGGDYDIYRRKFNTWVQWWSIRTTPRTKGTINYVKHFKAWQGLAPEGSGITNLVNNADIKLPDMRLGHVVIGLETSGAADASIWWPKCIITKPY